MCKDTKLEQLCSCGTVEATKHLQKPLIPNGIAITIQIRSREEVPAKSKVDYFGKYDVKCSQSGE